MNRLFVCILPLLAFVVTSCESTNPYQNGSTGGRTVQRTPYPSTDYGYSGSHGYGNRLSDWNYYRRQRYDSDGVLPGYWDVRRGGGGHTYLEYNR